MNVYQKLMNARIKFQSMELKKSGWNEFAKYHYFELGDFLPKFQEIFNEVGLCGVVSYTNDLATLTIADFESENTIVITSPMGNAKLKACHEVQNIGAVETYQRRYLWMTAFEAVEHDVLDATTGSGNIEAEAKQKPKPAKSVPADAWDNLSADMKVFLGDIAANVKVFLNRGDIDEAFDELESANLPPEDKAAIWAQFDSKQRSALKAEGESRKVAA